MKVLKTIVFLAFSAWLVSCKSTNTEVSEKKMMWLTTANQEALFEKIDGGISSGSTGEDDPLIEVNTSITYQQIDGYGFSLTGGSALHINRMGDNEREQLLSELFGLEEEEIGISYLRISIGASDLDAEPFSYNDLPQGETDIELNNFSIERDQINLIPVLKEILAINPKLKIMGSPWSAPVWMKTNNSTIGGSLRTEYYDVYANYFVQYIKAMEEEGISIDAITIQNEPEHGGNNPSMVMSSEEQKMFIKNHLGPKFSEENIDTKIIIWDHNADNPDYPISILNDPDANKYIDGSAFHLYAGEITALSEVHNAHPDKNIYFTEQWIGAPGNFSQDLAWHTRNLIVGATRNWSKTILQWNLASDPNQEPHTVGGCDRCLGGVTIEGNLVTRNPGYYIIAHASKFVRPGSIRVDSSYPEDLPNVAFITPEEELVLIILNDSSINKKVNFSIDGDTYSITLPRGAVTTLVL